MEVKKLHIATDFLVSCRPDLEGPLLGDKAGCAVFDNSKIKRLVPNFVAAKRFDEGVRESVEYALAHPESQKPDEEFDRFCDKLIEVQQAALNTFKESF